MGSSIDLAVSSVSSSLSSIGRLWRSLVVPLAKVYALEYAVYILMGIAVAAAVAIGIGGAAVGIDGLAALALIGVLMAVLVISMTVAATAVGFVAYKVIDSQGRDVPIINSALGMMVPCGTYLLAFYGPLVLLLAVLLGIGLLLASAEPILGFAALFAAIALSILVMIVIGFLFQFAPLEIAVGGADGFASLGKSYALVKKDLPAVLVFDFIAFAIAIAIGIPFSIVNHLASFSATLLGGIFPPLIFGVIFLWAALFFIQGLISGLVMLPVYYGFWKALRAKR